MHVIEIFKYPKFYESRKLVIGVALARQLRVAGYRSTIWNHKRCRVLMNTKDFTLFALKWS
jgi:hypothetical protein